MAALDCPSVSTRDVIRILLEHNLSRGIARCADSLIPRVRGDKYRRDTSPKQTAYADWTRQKGDGRKLRVRKEGRTIPVTGMLKREKERERVRVTKGRGGLNEGERGRDA